MSSLDQKSADQKTAGQKSASHAGRSLVARWRILAQQRLDYLIELYQSGRWKLYHKEAEFLALVQESRAALKVWEQLAPPDPIHDKPAQIALAQDDIAAGAIATLPQMTPSQAALNRVALNQVSPNGVRAEHDPRKR